MTTPVGTDGSEYQGLQIVNVVSSGHLGIGEIDTDTLGAELDADLSIMPGRVYLKGDEHAPMVMVFRSGCYTIAGATSWQDILNTLGWLFERLHEVGLEVDQGSVFNSMDIKYLVVTGDLGLQLDLETALITLGMEQSEYEPEQFPAIIHRPKMADCTVLLFSTGKITITGVKDIEGAYRVYTHIENVLQGTVLYTS